MLRPFQNSPSPTQSTPIARCCFTVSATAAAAVPGRSSQPGGAGSRPTCEVLMPSALFLMASRSALLAVRVGNLFKKQIHVLGRRIGAHHLVRHGARPAHELRLILWRELAHLGAVVPP